MSRLGLHHARGQAMVEFALVAPLFFLILLLVVEGGRFILYYQTLNGATREGARYAIVHGSRSGCPSGPMPPGEGSSCDLEGANVVERVEDSAFGLLGSGVGVVPAWPDASNERDSLVTVTATYTYSALIPLVALPDITVRAESTLVINN